MLNLIFAALILWSFVAGLRWFARADPKALAAGLKRGAGGALVLVAGFLLLARGNLEAAAALGALGLYLIGWSRSAPAFFRHFAGWGGDSQPTRLLRSPHVEIEIDLATGAMRGRVLAGAYAGRDLNGMTEAECSAALAGFASVDPEGARFLQFYLDRRFAGGRAANEAHEDARRRQRPGTRTLSEEDAYQMLGLAKGASREEITRAHRALMKKVHPDHGGTASLAALLNQAKDVLMQRHR